MVSELSRVFEEFLDWVAEQGIDADEMESAVLPLRAKVRECNLAAASPVGDETPKVDEHVCHGFCDRPMHRTKPAAQLIREIAAADPEGHNRRLARAYGVGDETPQPTCPHGATRQHYHHDRGFSELCPGPVGDVRPPQTAATEVELLRLRGMVSQVEAWLLKMGTFDELRTILATAPLPETPQTGGDE